MRFLKIGSACLGLILLFSFCFISCNMQNNGSENLSAKLFSNYTAEVEYNLTVNGQAMTGTARINKGKATRIDLLSPDPYTGLSIESDASGAPSILSFSYSGINVEFTPDAFSKINLAFKLLAPEVPTILEKMKREKTEAISDSYSLTGLTEITPVKIKFKNKGDTVSLIYDKDTGTPLSMSIKSNQMNLTVKIIKIKFE